MPRLAVLAFGDVLDVSVWSGTPYYATNALLRRYPDILCVRRSHSLWFDIVHRGTRKVSGGYVDLVWNETLARHHARVLARRLVRAGVSAVVCISISPLAAFLADYLHVIHVSDATAALMSSYYREFRDLHPHLAQSALRVDRLTVQRAKACLYATPWAAQSAIDDFGADPSRVHVVPFGGNVPSAAAADTGPRQDDASCRLVFIGVDWQRKRGDLAVEAVSALARRGVAARLELIGAVPPTPFDPALVTVHGFISKATAEGADRFNSIMRGADFLFVPTERECFGVFAAEGNAYGLPVISTRTGGLPGVILDGVNGYLLPPEAGAEAYAALIAEIWRDRPRYEALRRSALAQSRAVLNWQAWINTAGPIIDRVLQEAA